MKKTLPNSKVNRWLVLGIVALFSIAATFAVYNIVKNSNSSVAESDTQPEEAYVDNTSEAVATVSTVTNVDEGYVEIMMQVDTPITLAEFVLLHDETVEYVELLNNDLFADYLVSDQEEGKVRVGATGGPNAEIIRPTEMSTFARVYFNNLTEGSVVLDETEMTIIDDESSSVNIVVE